MEKYETDEKHKYIYINGTCKFIKKNKIVEGGLARNYAFMCWIQHNIKEIETINMTDNKIGNIFKVFSILNTTRRHDIIFQYPFIGVIVGNQKSISIVLNYIFLFLLNKASKQNIIIIDISDLKYEQELDLELSINEHVIVERVRRFENKLFKLPIKFIFASESMRKYACEKYLIDKSNTDVCFNGGNGNISVNELKHEKYLRDSKIKYVYAGTLNQGRQIEEMIAEFPYSDNFLLILMGSDGEWLNKSSLKENIIYLGALREEEAHYVVSKCDVGLIPYDDERLYYNLAYPTKLSFYITAGISFLSTPVAEVKFIREKYKVGFVSKITDWNRVVKMITKEDIENQKIKIEKIRKHFYWDNIFLDNKFIK